MPELKDASVIVGVPGLNGTGITSGEKTTITSDLAALKGASYIVKTADATLTGETALADLSSGLLYVTTGTGALRTATAADLPAHTHTTTTAVSFLIDGGGAVITTGTKGVLTVPFAGTITEWQVLADVSGSIQLDIWKDALANYPPTIADTITGTDKPRIVSSVKGGSTALTGWTKSVNFGDILRFNVDSATTITRVTVTLFMTRTI